MRLRQILLATLCAGAMAAASVGPARAADQIKVGFITTFSGTEAAYGEMEINGFKLALKHLGGKLGGLPVVIVTGDDEGKTDSAIQQASKMAERDRVDVFTGPALTTTVLGVDKIVRESKIPYISGGPGPSQLAGKGCQPYFFGAGWQNDALAETTGQYLTDKKADNIYLIAPQIAAGRDMLNGFKRYFKGKIAGEHYVGMTQLDFAAEISDIQAANPAGVFMFFPGGQGANFIQQWNQAGMKAKIPLYTMNALDQATLPALGDMALGIPVGTDWAETLDNPTNKKFVADYVATYGKLPSSQAAASYTTALMLDAAVRGVGGKIEDKPAFLHAIRDAKFTTLQGKPWQFGVNQMPVEDYYVATIARDAQGHPTMANPVRVFENRVDTYADQCKMPQG